jgi:PAS domain S-box-containing protein
MAALEAVIITDTRGRIILSNQYAARLTECSEKEMLMNKCNNVISLINSQTSEPIKDPIPEVVRQMVVVIHEFNTEIVTKSGKHRKVAVTVRPIKDEQNDLIGVFLHLKEKTLNQIRMDKITRPGFPESE